MRIVSFELNNYIKYIRITSVEERKYTQSPAPSIKKADTSQKIAIVNIYYK